MGEQPAAPRHEPPRRLADLSRAIAALARERNTTAARLQNLIANIVLAQMLPNSAVKGGTGLKLRFGDAPTRATPDLDTAFRGDLDDFYAELQMNLATGWGTFTGGAKRVEKRAPDGIPSSYVMQPFRVALLYKGRGFAGVDVEVGFDELEATTRDEAEKTISPDVLSIFAALGLPTPKPVRVLPLHHQVAQKLHACSEPGNSRAHDLVDLQLMAPETDRLLAGRAAARLFDFRKQHEWISAAVVPGAEWESLYAVAAAGLDVLPDVQGAAAWANGYMRLLRDYSSD